jgi:hypothetical protein
MIAIRMTMISILNNKFHTLLFIGAALFSWLCPLVSSAQEALSLSVSPTIFDMSANPGQEWTSSVRVINPNPNELTVFAEVVNFSPDGEAGQGRFLPLDDNSDGSTLAEWISVTSEEIVIPPEQTEEVPFTIQVPENAAPGGHFAAVLIGTRPPKGEQTQVATSQIVTTLLFLRVTGEVVESGSIRSFRAESTVFERPEVGFELRFENDGNVHILPQGEIEIFNMWGQTRGVIPINRSNLFGNVLPESVRKYRFTWSGEWSIADIGRYTAIASLAYGEEGTRQFASDETSFWIIPWRIVLGIIFTIILLVMIIGWGIKVYIRRMLQMSGVSPTVTTEQSSTTRTVKVSVIAPLEAGMLDLRQKWEESPGLFNRLKSLLDIITTYKLFLVVVLSIIAFACLIYVYINAVSISERSFNVTIDGVAGQQNISSEDLEYEERLQERGASSPIVVDETLPPIRIVNRSDVVGIAAEVRIRLEQAGYEVVEITNDLENSEDNTVILYDARLSEEALAVSQLLYGALLSAYQPGEEASVPITVLVGNDLKSAIE